MRYLLILFISATMITSSALACGFCPGDRIASVYCHESIKMAKETGRQYVVFEVIGTADEASFNQAIAALKKAKGVEPGRLKSAFAQKTVSFVMNKNQSAESLAESLNAGSQGFQLKVMQVVGAES